MILKLFAVKDTATDQFGNPMFLVAQGQAIRSFQDEANSKDRESQIARHPTDYTLHALGEYDTDTGLFTTHAPQQIARAIDLIIKE